LNAAISLVEFDVMLSSSDESPSCVGCFFLLAQTEPDYAYRGTKLKKSMKMKSFSSFSIVFLSISIVSSCHGFLQQRPYVSQALRQSPMRVQQTSGDGNRNENWNPSSKRSDAEMGTSMLKDEESYQSHLASRIRFEYKRLSVMGWKNQSLLLAGLVYAQYVLKLIGQDTQ
jgi:hypothetical protein